MFKKLEHPVLTHKLNRIREVSTPRHEVYNLVTDISSFMVYEVLRSAGMYSREIELWSGRFEFEFIDQREYVFVPILRAGIPMLEGALNVLPDASSGFIAQSRDELTLKSEVFYSKIPPLEGKVSVILDPMLATGGTLLNALREVLPSKPVRTISLHLVCAPEGVERVSEEFPKHDIYTVSLDEGLNDRGFILPGLGDMGDRLFS